jgi:hypothetical protein
MERQLGGQELNDNVAKQRAINEWFTAQLRICPDRFAQYLSIERGYLMNDRQRTLLKWFTIGVCIMLIAVTTLLSFTIFHNIAADRGVVYDNVLYKKLQWIIPILIALVGLLLTAVIGFVGSWAVLGTEPKPKQ